MLPTDSPEASWSDARARLARLSGLVALLPIALVVVVAVNGVLL